MVSLTGNVTVDEDGSAEFRCEIDANPMNKGQLISKDIIFGVNSFKKLTQKFVKQYPDFKSYQGLLQGQFCCYLPGLLHVTPSKLQRGVMVS